MLVISDEFERSDAVFLQVGLEERIEHRVFVDEVGDTATLKLPFEEEQVVKAEEIGNDQRAGLGRSSFPRTMTLSLVSDAMANLVTVLG